MPGIAARTSARDGTVRGQHVRFVHGHNARRGPEDYEVDEGGCWVWLRSGTRFGYGMLARRGRRVLAHRWYYEQAHGEIPAGMQLDHLCRNRACVNPDHLEVVTAAINAQRGANAKLDWPKVHAIRSSTESTATLADRYGVSTVLVWKIRTGKAWRE